MKQGFTNIRHLSHKLPVAGMILFIFILLGMGAAQHGSAASDTSGNPSTSPHRVLPRDVIPYGLELSELERAYDESLYRVLAPFFARGSFVADIRLEVEMRRTAAPVRTTTSSSPAQAPPPSQLPGMPYNPSDAQPATRREEVVVTAGAPSVRLELKRLNITIYADSRYSNSQLAFMEQLAAAAVKAEPQRGDMIRIIKQNFPDKTEFPAGILTPGTAGMTGDEHQVLLLEKSEKSKKFQPVRPLDFPGILLVSSSALLIFVLIYLMVVLNRRYA